MSPAYTSSTQSGKVHSSSSRLQDRGRIDYNTPRAKMSWILRTFRICASSTLEDTCRDGWSPGAQAAFFFRINLEATCHKIRNVNFSINKRRLRPRSCFIDFLSWVLTEATAMFMFYRLLVISFDRGHGHVHALYESTFAMTFDGCLRWWSHFSQQVRSVRLVYT
jgi:hypothetical protein